MEKFWNVMYRLKSVKRWDNSVSIDRESVAEHSYFVIVLVHILASIDKEMNNIDISIENLLVQAIYHDAFEAYTSHIISPVKHYDRTVSDAMLHLKEEFTNRLFNLSPVKYDNCDCSEEQEEKILTYIEIADAIEAYSYCAFQVNLGNKDFKTKFEIMKDRISMLMDKYNFVKYFFEIYFDENGFEIVY